MGADINARDHLSSTPLHYAANNGKDSTVSLLIQLGIYIDIIESRGNCIEDSIATL
jgi:ankyrin repeat protein